MGDMIEFTVYPKHDNVFYKITSSALMFGVKASGYAAIGLTDEPNDRCKFWVIIGEENYSYIWEENGRNKRIETRAILSDAEFRTFLITWHLGCIKFSHAEETLPILSFNFNNDIKLRYVTFGIVEGVDQPGYWRLRMPPIKEKPKYRNVTSDLAWISSGDQLPDGAIIGGHEDEALYIIRAAHQGSLTPGKFVPSNGLGYISWGGEEHEKNKSEVLCGRNCTWVWTNYGNIPAGAVIGGYSESGNEELYVGRAEHNGHLIPGKVQSTHRVCYIPYEGREIPKEQFQILINKDKQVYCDIEMKMSSIYIPRYNDRRNSEVDHEINFENIIVDIPIRGIEIFDFVNLMDRYPNRLDNVAEAVNARDVDGDSSSSVSNNSI